MIIPYKTMIKNYPTLFISNYLKLFRFGFAVNVDFFFSFPSFQSSMQIQIYIFLVIASTVLAVPINIRKGRVLVAAAIAAGVSADILLNTGKWQEADNFQPPITSISSVVLVAKLKNITKRGMMLKQGGYFDGNIEEIDRLTVEGELIDSELVRRHGVHN
jgi:hypothetical protein